MPRELAGGPSEGTINYRIKRARLAANLNQADVAESIGVARSTIVGWERGPSLPDVMNAARLADFYGVEVSDFLYADPERGVSSAWLEQRTHNSSVAGSNPAPPTRGRVLLLRATPRASSGSTRNVA